MPTEPTQKDVEEYAERIGMDLQNDRELLWIARQGLTKTTPASWKVCQTGPGAVCYFNYQTGETASDCDDLHAKIYKRCKAEKEQGLIEQPPPVIAEKPVQACHAQKEPPGSSSSTSCSKLGISQKTASTIMGTTTSSSTWTDDPAEIEKSADAVLQAFQTSDVKGTSSISKNSLERLFKMIDAESGVMDDEQIQKLLNLLGKDGDVSYTDLVKWVFFPDTVGA